MRPHKPVGKLRSDDDHKESTSRVGHASRSSRENLVIALVKEVIGPIQRTGLGFVSVTSTTCFRNRVQASGAQRSLRNP
jgi:hypothetical protein